LNVAEGEFEYSKPQLTHEELVNLRKIIRLGADFKIVILEGTHMVIPVVRVISHADENTVWMYCMREGDFSFGFGLSEVSSRYHCQCWIGNPITVDSFESFTGGTSGNIVPRRDFEFRLLYRL